MFNGKYCHSSHNKIILLGHWIQDLLTIITQDSGS